MRRILSYTSNSNDNLNSQKQFSITIQLNNNMSNNCNGNKKRYKLFCLRKWIYIWWDTKVSSTRS